MKDENKTFDFSTALQLLKEGSRVARKGWNGKNMFFFIVDVSRIKVNSPPLLDFYPKDTVVYYHPHIDMKTAQGYIVPWQATQTDLLSDDWVEVTDVK